MRRLIGLAVVLAVAASAAADLLWDNNIATNGSNGRAISPPAFPNIRVADDFVVPDGKRWVVEDIHYDGVEDSAWVWNDGDGIEVLVYEDTDGNGPGNIIATRTPGGSKMATGRTPLAARCTSTGPNGMMGSSSDRAPTGSACDIPSPAAPAPTTG